jgi:hypothetical protein
VSAVTVPPRCKAQDVQAVIAGAVNLLRFSEALARAGLIGRHDAARGVLVIEPAPEALIPQDAEVGMAWYNGLTPAERRHWHEVAGSAVAADAWRAFRGGAS